MTTVVAKRFDPERCNHGWVLLLHLEGRRVKLYCPLCDHMDTDIWPPGGVADLVQLEFTDRDGDKITVQNGQHDSKHVQAVFVDVMVYQSLAFSYRNPGGMDPQFRTRVEVKLRDA